MCLSTRARADQVVVHRLVDRCAAPWSAPNAVGYRMLGERDVTAEIAAAWDRELPGVATGSIGVVTPLWRAAKLLADERRRTLDRLGVDAATLDLLSTLQREGDPWTLTTRKLAARSHAAVERVVRDLLAHEESLLAVLPGASSRT